MEIVPHGGRWKNTFVADAMMVRNPSVFWRRNATPTTRQRRETRCAPRSNFAGI
jgi:hypothetical protein